MSGVHRPMSQMRKIETKEALFRARKRILKYLVLSFLKQEGLFHSAEALVTEANLALDYEVCDNIDLDIILQLPVLWKKWPDKKKPIVTFDMSIINYDARVATYYEYNYSSNMGEDYCSYYMMRFNKQPQFCRKVEAQPPPRPQSRPAKPRTPIEVPEKDDCVDLPSTFTVKRLVKDEENPPALPAIETKPLAGLLKNPSPERRQIVEMLYQEIIRPSGVTWNDIKGLDTAKSLLMESVVYPVRYPEVFTGLLEPWRGVLLHGPPGTGKTMLARAVAAESQCTFFNISCSTIVNKWRGESEKIVKILFEMASYFAPSIIFMDEVETLAAERGGVGEHEASRRLKAQLLSELDGVTRGQGLLFLLANTNMPWDIDPAMLRRLEKRIHVPLPDFKTRVELFETFLNSKTVELYPKVDFQELAAKTEGYSGSDVKLVCKEALMMNVRKMLPNMTTRGSHPARKDRLNLAEILTAIEKTRPVSKNLAQKHHEWQKEMGAC